MANTHRGPTKFRDVYYLKGGPGFGKHPETWAFRKKDNRT